MVQKDAIVDHGDVCIFHEFITFPQGTFKDDVIGLPFARLFNGVAKGRVLPVHCPALAVCIALVVVGIEELDFIVPEDDQATVAATLAVPFDFGRGGEFQVELEVPEILLGLDRPGLGCDFHEIADDFPFDGLPWLCVLPAIQTCAVEEDRGVGWRGCQVAE